MQKSTRPSEGATPKPSPVDLVRVPFHGEAIDVLPVGDEHWLPLRSLCDRFGVSVQGQLEKLKSTEWVCIKEILMQMPGDDQARWVSCLHLRSFAGWLLSVKAGKVKPEVRDALVRYQREAADVLYRHFFPQAANDHGDLNERIEAAVRSAMSPVLMVIKVQQETILALTEQTRLLAEQVDAQTIGIIGKGKHERWVKARLTALAEKLAPLEGEPAKNQRTRLENALRFAVDFFGPIETLPVEKLAMVQRHLFEVERQLFRRMRRRGRGLAKTSPPGQMKLALVPEAKPKKSG